MGFCFRGYSETSPHETACTDSCESGLGRKAPGATLHAVVGLVKRNHQASRDAQREPPNQAAILMASDWASLSIHLRTAVGLGKSADESGEIT